MKRLNLLVILAVFLSGCGSVPATDWCYTFSFSGGLPIGWSGAATDSVGVMPIGGEVNLFYSRSTFTPSYAQFFVVNSGSSRSDNVIGSGWGATFEQFLTIPSGESSGYIALGAAGSSGELYIPSTSDNVRLTAVRFYGNGTNPFPSNECESSATATPSGTATPVSLTLDTNGLFSQTNGWISVFVPLFALFVGVPVAVAILAFIGRSIIQALRGGR